MVLKVEELKVHFPIRKGILARTVGYVKAVDGVSFDLKEGEILGIIGGSGSGKTTVARVICGLQHPTAGKIEFAAGAKVAMVFQDPLGSLNSRQTVRAMLGEIVGASSARIIKLVEQVGLDESCLDKYPHEFSGGQRQRLCIARAIALDPKILVCDEAVSALDLSIRSQILDLLLELRRELKLSIVFITHDLGVVRYLSDRILVMRNGRLFELNAE